MDKLLLTPTFSPNDDIKVDMLWELQASILKHHKKQHVYYFFIRFNNNVQAAKDWIANFTLNKVSSAYQELTEGEESVYGLYLTHQAYKYLGVREGKMPGNESSVFSQGLLERVKFKNKGPEDIEAVFQDKDKWHAVVMFALNKPLQKGQELQALDFNDKFRLQDVCDINTVQIQKGGKIPNPHAENRFRDEWFGFKDMISEPQYFERKKRSVKDKIFPFGLALTPDNGGQNWYSCGSYVAFMKIEQDVDAFNQAVENIDQTLALNDKGMAEAYLMGRFKNGTSISVDNKPSSADRANFNDDFHYDQQVGLSTDQFGSRCPFHAHARRANPRTADTEDKTLTRRGIPYDDREIGGKVGMLFMSFQHSLEDQFEVVLNDWLLSSFINEYPMGQDAIVGDDHTTHLLFPVEWNSERHNNKVPIKLEKNLTKFKGGLYLFAPSLSFLLSLSPEAYGKWQKQTAKKQSEILARNSSIGTGIRAVVAPPGMDTNSLDAKRLVPFEPGTVMLLEKVSEGNTANSLIPSDESEEMKAKRNAKFIEGKEEKLKFRFKNVG